MLPTRTRRKGSILCCKGEEMKSNNVKALRRLSFFCRYSGLICLFAGILVIFLDVFNRDWLHAQIGFFIFVTGYANAKIGAKLSSVLFDERSEAIQFETK